MFGIPRAPLLLGLAGLLPFMLGALISTLADIAPSADSYPIIIANDGIKILVLYGTIILSFMSGVLWGFATKAEGAKATTGYILSVMPTLWAFFMRGGKPVETLPYLIAGFLGLLVLDYFFNREGLTPPWWMPLRILLTSIVVICLGIGAFA
jgi:hypothetical protein|tara:strand:+ start:84 stop:539 length:456 start_codon:yes stop_codon:yes gene_type:complete